jgi:hypothetical protein
MDKRRKGVAGQWSGVVDRMRSVSHRDGSGGGDDEEGSGSGVGDGVWLG